MKETSNIHLDVVKYEKDLLVESIRHVIAGMEDLNGKIENVRSQIDQQVAAVEEEEKKNRNCVGGLQFADAYDRLAEFVSSVPDI